jgi:hypothetical protein
MRCNATVVLVVLNALAYNVAHAQTLPSSCQATRDQRAYATGQRSGASLIRQAWRSVNDCDRVEQFEDLVMNTVDAYAPGPAPTNYSLCRYSGVIDGILNELDNTFIGCSDACLLEGQFAGELSAVAYCELSIALDGLATADAFLRGPVQVCGLNFEVGCDSEFLGVCTNYQNDEGSCLPYTEDTFFAVFDQARTNQCAYNPLPPDKSTPPKNATGDTDPQDSP